MKLYVFQNVLHDYGSGLIVVLAMCFEDAVRSAQNEIGYEFPFSMDNVTIIEDLANAEPFVAYVTGGG